MSMDTELARNTLAVVLAGGNGTRLGELTRWQCKPAVPFAGHFRNVDFTLSNCLNSNVRRIGVLTQYKAQTLIGHITSGWNVLPRHLGEFIDVWPAQQRLRPSWYAGTADAVYQNLDLIVAQRAPYTLVLAGDHVYKMDYRPLIQQHAASGANVTVACVPVPTAEASAFGVLGVDTAGRVNSFLEKPSPASLGDAGARVLASMGIYVFRTDYLVDRLERDAHLSSSAHDFGRDILPNAVRENHVGAYLFTDASGRPGYWRDVGTLEAYWQAHMDLLAEEPPIDLCDPAWPIWTQPMQLPPARVICNSLYHGLVANSMLSGGTVIRGAMIDRSVLGPNVSVGEHTILEESVILPGARIGANCTLRRVIVDANTQIPDGTIVDALGDEGEPDGEVRLLTSDSIADGILTETRRSPFTEEPAAADLDRIRTLPSTTTMVN